MVKVVKAKHHNIMCYTQCTLLQRRFVFLYLFPCQRSRNRSTLSSIYFNLLWYVATYVWQGGKCPYLQVQAGQGAVVFIDSTRQRGYILTA